MYSLHKEAVMHPISRRGFLRSGSAAAIAFANPPIFLASAYSGVSVKQYSSLFDTVYISLYKYFGAAGGAILCGSDRVLSTIPHLMKIHGGVMFRNWHNAAVALHTMQGFDDRFAQARTRSE